MVSYNAGITYSEEATAEDPSSFDIRCGKLDAQMVRWTIEDEEGEPCHRACAIHRGIFSFMQAANAAASIEDARREQGQCRAKHPRHKFVCDLKHSHGGPHQYGGVNTWIEWDAESEAARAQEDGGGD